MDNEFPPPDEDFYPECDNNDLDIFHNYMLDAINDEIDYEKAIGYYEDWIDS